MSAVLIVGGYGHVGQQVVAHLTKTGNADVRIGGRDHQRCSAMAQRFQCEWALLDLDKPNTWDDALVGIRTVLVCSDTATADFPAHVLVKGLNYVDISATDAVLRRIEALDELARLHGGCAVLSVGLAPGLTNLMAREAVSEMTRVESVTIGVMLGLGDAHGPAAVDWTLGNLLSVTPDDVQMLGFGQP